MSGSYFGVKLSESALEGLRATERETLEAYEIRLADDCTNQRPEWYFQRRMIPRTDAELLEYAKELWGHGQDILHARREDRWPRNSGACMLYGRPCKFLAICSGYDSPDSDKWQRKQFVHNELPQVPSCRCPRCEGEKVIEIKPAAVGHPDDLAEYVPCPECKGEGMLYSSDGRDILTNSRIRCFQTCKRKHYYEYELGIERLDEEEAESLFFGNLWHVAQAAWWRPVQSPTTERNEHGNSYTSQSATGVGTAYAVDQ
jgi:hypothetical protein